MKNLLVKMSRNSKIMVPVVAVVALGIYSGSYIIRHRDTVARQEEQAQQEDARKADENFQTLETQEKQETSEDKSSADDSSSVEKEVENEVEKETPDVEKVSMTVSASASQNSITVSGTMTTSKPGVCTVTLIQKGVVLGTETNRAANGECTVILPRPNVTGEVKVQLTYRSDDSTAKGVEDTDINL